MPSTPDITLYAFTFSGHAHRAELFLNLLKLPYQRIEVDLRGGSHKQPDFLQLNPFGQVPVLVDGDITLPDSNAILVYLAKRYGDAHWLPEDPVEAARVQRWLSVAAGELLQGPALARLQSAFYKGDAAPHRERAKTLLALLEAQLASHAFLTGNAPTIADIALYTYTAIAPEGGISLEAYPSVQAWLKRVEALPNFLPMPRLPQAIAS